MIDYKQIADGDPSGDLDTAYAAMAAETINTTPEQLMTYRSIASKVSFAASAELESAILAVPAYSGWLNTDLQARGIDVNDAQVAGLIGTIVSAPTAAAIVAAGIVVVPKYAGLKIGHLANARQQRAAGEV